MKNFWHMLVQSYKEWNEDKAPKQAAALAYYTIFSLAPLVTIIITLLGIFYRESDISSVFMAQVSGLVGESGGTVFKTITEAAAKPQSGMVTALVSTVTMIFGATGVFIQLKEALNTAWGIKEDKSKGVKGQVKVRAIALAGVIVVFFLLLISLFVSSVISSITGRFNSEVFVVSLLIGILNRLITVTLMTFLFAFIFKYLPDTEVTWKDVWVGALFTSVLFNIGKFLIGLYLGNSNVGSAFGAAGSILVVLVWVYYSALLVLFGAEFTQVYSEHHGTGAKVGTPKSLGRASVIQEPESVLPRRSTLLPAEKERETAKSAAERKHRRLRRRTERRRRI